MIHIIGIRKAIIIGVLVALNALLGAALYFYLIPESSRIESEMESVKSQAAQKQVETQTLRQEYETIQEQRSRFESLGAVGFFSDQNRFVARRRIEQIKEFTNVMTAKYDIGSAKIEENDQIRESQHALLDSPVQIDIEAMDDINFYNFIYWVENGFPGHVSVNNISIKRNGSINDAVLREIASGTPVALMNGTIKFDWHTILSESEISKSSIGQQGM